MNYGNVTYATLTGGTTQNAYEVRFGYQVVSEDIPNNSRQVKLQLEVRSVKSAYGSFGFTQTSTIDGVTLSGATFDMRNTNAWQVFGSRTITINGAYSGTKSGSFTTDATTSSGNYTLKSGSASVDINLSSLHRPPIPNSATMVETNQVLTNINLTNTTIVQHLSKKTITLTPATTYDGATATYKLEHLGTGYVLPASGYQSSTVFNADYTQNGFMADANGKARIFQRVEDNMGGGATDWLKVTINGVVSQPDVILYAKPNLIRTSTNIKRKSGGGTVLTDNKAVLNLTGTFYKGSDVVGNNNNIQQIGYKIWATDESEPANYTTLTPTVSGGNITVTNLEISNIIYTKVYNYKIILTDRYGYPSIQEGTVPAGVSVWTEYKDRVDFLKLTVGGYNPFEYSDNETICGIWMNKPLYRKVVATTTSGGYNHVSLSSISSNIETIINVNGFTIQPSGNSTGINYYYTQDDYSHYYYDDNLKDITIRCGNTYGFGDVYLIVEYTKTSD